MSNATPVSLSGDADCWQPQDACRSDDRAYGEAVAVLQAHHDRPSTVPEQDLAYAFLRGYLPHWQRHIRFAAYRHGFTAEDVDDVVDDATTEFFLRKITTGQFDPSRGEFAIFKTLIKQRAIDRHRYLKTSSGIMNRPGRIDIADQYLPSTSSAEVVALAPDTTEEEANATLCREARLDERETLVITYRYVYQWGWDEIILLVNAAHADRPIGLPRLRNIHTEAKHKLRNHLAHRSEEESDR